MMDSACLLEDYVFHNLHWEKVLRPLLGVSRVWKGQTAAPRQSNHQ